MRNQKNIRAFFLLILSFLFLCISGCSPKPREKLIVGTETNFPPFTYLVNEKSAGIDIDILQYVAKKYNMELVIEDFNFSYLSKALLTKKIDLAASGITITPERKKMVDFSEMYADSALSIILPVRSPIRSVKELKGKLLGVQKGSTGDEYVTKNIKEPSRFSDVDHLISNLAEGKIDAAILDAITAKVLVRNMKNLKMLETPLSREEYGFAVRKDRKDLLEKINHVIAELKKDGTLAKIIAKHEAYTVVKNEKKRFYVAIDPTFPPIGYIKNGEPTGIEIDILKQVAAELEMNIELEQVGFDSLFAAVANDNGVDIGAGSISITKDRLKIVNFTVPYFSTEQYFFIRKNSAVTTMAQAKNKKIGVILGTTSEKYAKEHFKNVECYSEAELVFKALSRGVIEGAVMDGAPSEFFLRKYTEVKKLPTPLMSEVYAFAVRKERTDLLNKINEILLRMQADGSIKKITEKHFKAFQK